MKITCPVCFVEVEKANGAVNRARSIGAPVYCGRTCAGIGRRDTRTLEQKRADKALYDAEYRNKNKGMLKEKKKRYYKETMTPEKRQREKEYRQQVMQRHVEYCRRPEYKQYKQEYDRKFRARKYYGDFWECFLVVQDIDAEIASRMSNYELYQSKGTLNKAQLRRKEYERTFSYRP